MYSQLPYWRSKWLEQQQKVHPEQKEGDLRPGEKKLLEPKGIACGNNARWQSNYDECCYHLGHCAYMQPFYKKVWPHSLSLIHPSMTLQAIALSDSENVKALHDLLSSQKNILCTRLAFASCVLQPLYETIKALQKESGGNLDVLSAFLGFVLAFTMVPCSNSTGSRRP